MTQEMQFLIDSLVERLTQFLIEDDKLTLIEALNVVYHSELYEKILDTETGLYFQSAAYNYHLLRKELTLGKIA